MTKRNIGRAILSSLMIFMGGFIVAMNVVRLVPKNDSYEASWFKVGFATFIAIGAAVFGKER